MRNTEEDERIASPAELRFAEWLRRLTEGEEVDFDAFVAETPDLERDLRGIKDAWDSARHAVVSARPAAPAGSSELAFGYELLEEIGSGGFGRVYRARDRGLDREVAIKAIAAGDSAQARRRFVAEAQLLASVEHPNVVRVHTVLEESGEVHLVTELIEGRDLARTVETQGPLGEREAAGIAIDVCRALSALHGKELVHLDVKPGNIMRGAGGRTVLLDFGFARERSASADSGDRPLGGTPPFMAPEHLLGLGSIGPSADIYGLAATLYWCVSRAHPFDFETSGVIDRVLDGHPVPLSDARADVDPDFAAIVERGLSRRPEDRFATAGEFEAALRAWLAAAGPAEAALAPTPPRPSAVAWFSAVAVIAAIALVAVLWPDGDAPPDSTTGRAEAADARGQDGPSTLAAIEPLDVDVRFMRRVDSGSDPDRVEGVEIASNDPLPEGAEVWFEVVGREPYYLYIFNQDADGRQYCLVPEGPEAEHHAANETRRMPATEQFVVTDLSAREHVFVVASQTRVAWLDLAADMIERPQPGAGGPDGRLDGGQSRTLRSTMRSIGGRTEEEDEPTGPAGAGADLIQLFAEYDEKLEGTDERVVVEHYELVND